MATRNQKSLVSFSLIACAAFGLASRATDNPVTEHQAVSSQKRSDMSLRGQTAKFDQPDDGTGQATMASDNVLSMSPETAKNLMAQAEQALSAGHINYAIKVARKCVAEDALDIDARIILARALTEKYRAQDDKQSALLKELLEQYLYVARHGENDTFQSKFAQQKMFDLTGVKWHPWTSQSAFLKKALPGSGLVAGTVLDNTHTKADPLH